VTSAEDVLGCSRIADIGLADEGERRIEWVARHSPVLNRLARQTLADGALRGRRVAVVIHLEAKTAYLATLLAEAGATVVAASSNTGSTNDSVCAALVRRGIEVHALHGASQEEQEADLLAVADTAPELIVDDGAILANTGATDDEFDMTKLRGRALEARMVRPNVEEFRLDDDRSVLVVGDGKVVNLSAGEGQPDRDHGPHLLGAGPVCPIPPAQRGQAGAAGPCPAARDRRGDRPRQAGGPRAAHRLAHR
jgi:S-adenosylhomocysteine hydrolase